MIEYVGVNSVVEVLVDRESEFEPARLLGVKLAETTLSNDFVEDLSGFAVMLSEMCTPKQVLELIH